MSSSKLLRVTQLDALYLDREVFKMLLQILHEISSYLPAKFSALYTAEMELLLKCLILYYSIIKNGNTFGQQLLAIKYENMTNSKRTLYSILSCFDCLPKLNVLSQFTTIYKIILQFDALLKVCSFINISYFLRNGRYPLLLDRMLGLKQVYAQDVERSFESKYLARELLWNGFIEILVYIIPLINYHKLKRMLMKVFPLAKRSKTEHSKLAFTTQTMCTHCRMSPILPYRMNCPHIFCYTCLKGNQIADPQYECPICQFPNPVTICERVTM